ncbi:hypothetical protein B0H13DRAFT_1878751 [Mycena leptocephala]|nr:hypothetical protein B0H13DRAFT_1878751 [Mycena leptocephala]
MPKEPFATFLRQMGGCSAKPTQTAMVMDVQHQDGHVHPKKSRGCMPPQELASGPVNRGCICLAPSDPPISIRGEKCGIVPYYDPADEAVDHDPPGRRICQISPEDVSNSRCITQCIAGYRLIGNSLFPVYA